MRFCAFGNCQSPVFGTDKITRIGYCKMHQSKRTDLDRRSIVQKAMAKQKGKVENKEPDKVKDAEMELFWLSAIKKIRENPYCENCGTWIPDKRRNKDNELVDTTDFYRAASAHVLPKREIYGFPSVASNLDNLLILSASCGCHGRYDKSWEDAVTMKVFPKAIEIFKKLYPHIAKSELKNLPEVFLQEIEI